MTRKPIGPTATYTKLNGLTVMRHGADLDKGLPGRRKAQRQEEMQNSIEHTANCFSLLISICVQEVAWVPGQSQRSCRWTLADDPRTKGQSVLVDGQCHMHKLHFAVATEKLATDGMHGWQELEAQQVTGPEVAELEEALVLLLDNS